MAPKEPQIEFTSFVLTPEQTLDEALRRVYARYNGDLKMFFDEVNRERPRWSEAEPIVESGLLVNRLRNLFAA